MIFQKSPDNYIDTEGLTQPTKFPRAGWKASITKSRRYGGRATDIQVMTIFSSSSLMLQEKFISEITQNLGLSQNYFKLY